jgi:hypothetical protein
MIRVFIFDMDGTLTESKQSMTVSMGKELAELLTKKHVGVISGASFPQFKKQFISHLPKNANIGNLFILPMNGSELWEHDGKKWACVYQEVLKPAEITKIKNAFLKVAKKFPPEEKVWGDILDNRGSQITFSGLGSKAPLDKKALWDPEQKKRKKMRLFLKKLLPNFEITIGGTTSIDVTRKGITKAFGVKRAMAIYGFKKKEVVFVGDAIFPGGNDYAVSRIGIQSVKVAGPDDTRKVLRRSW